MIDVRDNNYTDRSPCLTCPRHLQGLDKNDCLNTCKRLKAYRNGQSWENEEMVKIDDEISTKKIKYKARSNNTLQKTKKTRGNMPGVKKTSMKRNKADISPKPKQINRNKVLKLYMTKYPEIMQYIIETAQKSLLPAKHIFIQLLSEAIAARKRKDGDKS